MENTLIAAAEKCERRIKRGFPAGELKSELLAEAYTEQEVMIIIEKTNEISRSKTKDKSKEFSFFIAALLTLSGICMQYTGISAGWLFIVSGITKLVYNFFINKQQ